MAPIRLWMRVGGRVLAGILLFIAAFLLPGKVSAAPPPHAPQAYVIIQRPATVAAWGATPGLRERGFEKVPVPPGWTAEAYAAALRSRPGILAAVPDAPVYAARAPNDPLYPVNQVGYLSTIGAPQAWDFVTGRPEVVVAVLDTGADLSHPDLAPRLWTNPGEVPGDGIDNDGNGCIDDVHGCRFVDLTAANRISCGYSSSTRNGDVRDDNGTVGSAVHSHGTMVAGIVGAAGNNGLGIAGVAWDVRLMIVKVLDCGGPGGSNPSGSMFNVAEGIDYAVRMGARIINLSLASAPGDPTADTPALRAAIEFALSRGVLIVAAAGNWGSSANPAPGYPAAYTQYPNVIGVGAMDPSTGGWASYSAYGSGIDFAAPGEGIASTVRTDLGGSLPYRISDKGTSFATPLVSGSLALLASRNTRLGYGDYVALLADTASPAPPAPHGQNWAGAGIIHVGNAARRVPAVISGNALHDWKDVGPGVEVRAYVGTTLCGSTQTFSFGPASPYIVRVAADAEMAGCGAAGRVVRIYLGGQPAVPTITWPGPEQDLGLVDRDVSTVTPDPGPIVTQQLGGSWANLAHLEANGDLPAALAYLPSNWSAVYFWDANAPSPLGGTGRYLRLIRDAPDWVNTWERVLRYDAYWVEAPTPSTVASVNPNPPPGRVVSFAPGWNNFVYTGTTKRVSEALQEISGKYTQVLHWDNAAGVWQFHIPGQSRFLNDFEALVKFRVYWIYVTTPVSITMN